jgi:hypothetical protein
MAFASADTLIPDPYNPLDWNRYAYVRGSPLGIIDPSGHSPCDVAGADPECNDPSVQRAAKINERLAAKKNASSNTSSSSPTTGSACLGPNRSVVCKDPTLLSEGQVQTDVVYPTYQTPSNYDGPYADEACVHPVLCLLLLTADAAVLMHYQTGTSSFLKGSYVTANVNYEVHRNHVGHYTTVTSLDITNRADGTISLREVVINDSLQFSPTLPIRVDSGQSLTAVIQPYNVPGRSGSISITFTSNLYSIMVLTATYP